MSIPAKLNVALAKEIESWAKESIISDEQAKVLLARYPAKHGGAHAITLVTIIGAVLVGLGTLLYIGANWTGMATIWKLIIIATAIVASHVAGWIFKFEPGNRPKLGTAFLLLGSLFYGGAIWLIAQIFNVDVQFPNGLLLWLIGTAACALTTRSVPLGILASVILSLWTMQDLSNWSHYSSSDSIQRIIGIVAGLGAAWFMRSQAMAWIILLASSAWVAFESGCYAPGLLFWGIALFGGYLAIRNKDLPLESPLKYVGACSALAALLAVTCNRMNWGEINQTHYAATLGAALIIHGLLLYTRKDVRREILGCLAIIACFILVQNNYNETVRAIAFNAMLLASIFALAATALQKLHSPGLLNTALAFVVFDIICRYFDIFFSMMDRSMFFILGGILLMVGGALAEKGRRQLLGSMES
ncbi:MAG: DUF2157 domain-containing protein [Candidatus Obscuribacterales bacterium]|jgi:uncharacterized membrane protein